MKKKHKATRKLTAHAKPKHRPKIAPQVAEPPTLKKPNPVTNLWRWFFEHRP